MRVPTTNQVIPGAHVNIVLKADQSTGRTVSGKIQDVLTRGNHPRGIKVRLVDGRIGRVQSMLSTSTSASSSQTQTQSQGGQGGSSSFSTAPSGHLNNTSTPGFEGSDHDHDQFEVSRGEGDSNWGSGGPCGRGRGGRRREDVDTSGGIYPPQPERQALGLDAYIKPARNQKRTAQRGGIGTGTRQQDTNSVSVDVDVSARSTHVMSATCMHDSPEDDFDDFGGTGEFSSSGSGGIRLGQQIGSTTITCPVCGDFEGDEGAVAHHVAGHFGE